MNPTGPLALDHTSPIINSYIHMYDTQWTWTCEHTLTLTLCTLTVHCYRTLPYTWQGLPVHHTMIHTQTHWPTLHWHTHSDTIHTSTCHVTFTVTYVCQTRVLHYIRTIQHWHITVLWSHEHLRIPASSLHPVTTVVCTTSSYTFNIQC